jgi:DNA-binding MarR family transcriptional regulator
MTESSEKTIAERLLEAFMGFRRINVGHPQLFSGLTPGEARIIFHLKRMVPPDGPGVKVSELSNLLLVTTPTMTKQINNLETVGYVVKSADPDDGRVVRVRVTPSGDVAIREARDKLLAAMDGLVAYLGEEDSTRLAELLTRAFTYLHEVRGAHTADDGRPTTDDSS